ALPYELRRTPGLPPVEPRLRMQGMFRDQADAARFRDCRSNLSWPVAMSDDYRALEKAYGEHRSAPGAELLVLLEGRIERRLQAEGSGTQRTLVVERYLRGMPGDTCEPGGEQAGLANTRWRPLKIGERTVTVSGQEHEPWLALDAQAKRVTGSGGCNRFSGPYESGEGTLRFGPLM